MPNHYHFMVLANDQSVIPKSLGPLISNELSNGFRNTQSQYAQYFNNKYELSGSVFRHKPKAKCLNEGDKDYSWTCFAYIHQNPVKAGLCNTPFEWKHSSALEIRSYNPDSLVSLSELNDLLGIRPEDMETVLSESPAKHRLKRIF